jgi:hypothetical protein
MKKTIFAAAALLFLLMACGESEDPQSQPEAQESTQPAAESESVNDSTDADAADAPDEASTEAKTVEAIGMVMTWTVADDHLEVELSGPTTGWIAVGFNPTRAMRDADILIGYVDGSEVIMTDQFGTSMTTHAEDDRLGGESNVEVISGNDDGSRTTITFRIPLDSGDEYDHALTPGETYPVIFAYGEPGADNTDAYHANRAGAEITL